MGRLYNLGIPIAYINNGITLLITLLFSITCVIYMCKYN